ncbi:hypothetical protein V5799_023175 [Amblyomma americanum]|uniref:LITAF domain-containing protein n=1 Tax=Amblyomma americanum TaxID=6943 RepID=A0AAQ4FKD2_AMBAM
MKLSRLSDIALFYTSAANTRAVPLRVRQYSGAGKARRKFAAGPVYVDCYSYKLLTAAVPSIITRISVITVYSQWGPLPVPVICPYCRQQIVTKIVHRPGFLTWMLCGSLAALGCILGCCLVPFCINSCQDIVHVCPHCSRTLGNFRMI